MRRYAPLIDGMDTITGILELVRDICIDHGVLRMSYHFSPIFDEPVSLRTVVYAHGFSPEWLKLYEDSDFRSHDPIPQRTLAHGQFLTWFDAMEQGPNTPENDVYFEAMKKAGLQYGFGVPLYGARGREAYASFDFGKPLSEVSSEKVGMVRALARAAHVRICHLIDKSREVPPLSSRETEVMSWIARGKTSQEIGIILDLSPETVKTYIKRVYAKLDAHDRIGATIRALKLGLVRI